MAKTKIFDIETRSDLPIVTDFLTPYLTSDTLILLEGPMAAGKTTLISELLKIVGIFETHSPTYAIHHLYKTDSLNVHHFDLHRLTTTEDIESSGFWDFFESVNSLFFVEWSNSISDDQWPYNLKKIRINIIKKETESRKITIDFMN